MKVIPVIDLKNGVVVHARQGNREFYQPIQTPLCRSSDVFRVIEAFLSLAAFDTFYIADLNAITRQGNHESLISKLLSSFPELLFWVDSGYQPPQKQPHNYLPVLGSESYNAETVTELAIFDNKFILSLDYSSNRHLGPTELFTNAKYWPDTLIIMTLERVGSNQGADYDKLAEFCRKYPQKSFVAAGGIRHFDDLTALKQLGINNALVASALHSGAIGSDDLEKLQAKKYPGKPRYF